MNIETIQSDTRKYIKTWDNLKGNQFDHLLNFLQEANAELTAAEISNKTGISINSVRANLYQFLKKDLVSKLYQMAIKIKLVGA